MTIPTRDEWRAMSAAQKIAVCEEVKSQYRDPRQVEAIDRQIAWYKNKKGKNHEKNAHY